MLWIRILLCLISYCFSDSIILWSPFSLAVVSNNERSQSLNNDLVRSPTVIGTNIFNFQHGLREQLRLHVLVSPHHKWMSWRCHPQQIESGWTEMWEEAWFCLAGSKVWDSIWMSRSVFWSEEDVYLRQVRVARVFRWAEDVFGTRLASRMLNLLRVRKEVASGSARGT